MIREKLLSGVQDADVAYIYDPRDNSRWGLLRGLPAIYYLGVGDFTYPTSWCQFEFGNRVLELDYDYHVVSTGLDIPEHNPNFGVVTNDHYEQETQYTIKYLINRYTVAGALLFVLVDSKRFQPQGSKRPLYQEPFADLVGRYASVYEKFEVAYEEANWELPLADTKNLFIQDNANLYEYVTGESVSDTTELFEVIPDAPFLPLYDPMVDVFSRETNPGTVPLDAETGIPELVRWLRRRIEWDRDTARDVAYTLNEAVVADGSTFDFRAARRAPSAREARLAADDLTESSNPIDQRYATWLTRYEL
jgi:hypothetical protein